MDESSQDIEGTAWWRHWRADRGGLSPVTVGFSPRVQERSYEGGIGIQA